MKSKPHPTHQLESRASPHYDFICIKCNVADTPFGWGKLVEPCTVVSNWCGICKQIVSERCEDTDTCAYYFKSKAD